MTFDAFFRHLVVPGFLVFAAWGLFATGREAWEQGGRQACRDALRVVVSAVRSTWTAIRVRVRSVWDALSRQQPPTMPWRW